VLVGAGALLREAAQPRRVVRLEVDQVDQDQPVGQAQGSLDGVGQALTHALAHDEAVDDDLDVVLELLVELGHLTQPVGLAVDAHAGEAAPLQLGEQLGVLPLPPPHHRGQDLEAGALLHGADLVDDLLGRLGGDDGVAHGAVLDAGAGVEQPQVVVDLGDGAHR